ncbi:hypothetical protein BKK52_01415 [Rodentibacter trehalosifermentans]|uniref:Uncharacterized protein n=1 Tax=Rodentibacter trehalosifermentans TaxID=1908263 RepID=A0A1V3J6Z6_9PAST|nr:hypothetical protein [Rodentibacter trehalosifermentans]OOF50831.1 hypothetical protein BKK52_01415 [Rodentibacter trehalosifermentans]
MKNKNLPPSPKFSALKLYLKPYIPRQKLRGALESYVADENVEADDILLLTDDTVFGSAKRGLVFTNKRFFYWDNNGSGYGSISDINAIDVEPGTLSHDIYFKYKGEENEWWHLNFTQARANDIKLLKKYLTEVVEQLQAENIEEDVKVEEEIVEQTQKEQAQFDEEQLRLEIRKQLILEEEKRKFEEEQKQKAQQQALIEIEPNNSVNTFVQPGLISQQLVKSRYIGTRINDDGSPEPRYLGEPIEEDQFNTGDISINAGNQDTQSSLISFLQNNSDGIIAKLKDSGLSLTASALQNDENIIRIAGFIYNFLPMPVRFFVSVNTLEQFLMNNRQWLINKLN